MSKGAHPKHPPCPECGKAMYKAAVKGTQVKKTDPWAFCRNKNCKLHGKNQAATKWDLDGSRKVLKETKRDKPPKRKAKSEVPAPPPPPAPAPPAPEAESESVSKARNRVREVLRKALAGADKTAVGIVLALVSQETGNHTAANVLIDEYKLDELLGIQKVEGRNAEA